MSSEHLRIKESSVVSVDDDRLELRKIARSQADINELYLRGLIGDDEYEDWNSD